MESLLCSFISLCLPLRFVNVTISGWSWLVVVVLQPLSSSLIRGIDFFLMQFWWVLCSVCMCLTSCSQSHGFYLAWIFWLEGCHSCVIESFPSKAPKSCVCVYICVARFQRGFQFPWSSVRSMEWFISYIMCSVHLSVCELYNLSLLSSDDRVRLPPRCFECVHLSVSLWIWLYGCVWEREREREIHLNSITLLYDNKATAAHLMRLSKFNPEVMEP